ncbi:hypothetical protein ACQEUU_04705 [Nonomuraea sp. CA-218870]|uniref:hypothetical protein n=1 Tax=Nonomuraea sp. CA-218870 TaxID=3239998 RepID=UPI003D8BBDFD
MQEWEPYVQYGMLLRMRETSCCGEYEWCCEGGLYFVRRNGDGYETTPRSRYAQARPVWEGLIRNHRHTSQRQRDGKPTSSGCDRARPSAGKSR